MVLSLTRNSSAKSSRLAAENYSNLPVAIDEFGKVDIDPNKLAVLHNVANRQLESKWIADGGKQRVIKTSFLVGGECTVNDSAFRSRYAMSFIGKPLTFEARAAPCQPVQSFRKRKSSSLIISGFSS
jgi:hypothetical protein